MISGTSATGQPPEAVDDDIRASRRITAAAARDDAPAPDDGADDLRLAAVVLDVADVRRAADFWASALGYLRLAGDPPGGAGDDAVTLVPPAGTGVALCLRRGDTSTGEAGGVWLQLYASEPRRHLRRLTQAGARLIEDEPARDAGSAVVAERVWLRDPDGGVFCVVDHPRALIL